MLNQLIKTHGQPEHVITLKGIKASAFNNLDGELTRAWDYTPAVGNPTDILDFMQAEIEEDKGHSFPLHEDAEDNGTITRYLWNA